MVLGVCLELGEPDDFLGVDALAINHGRDLPVGTAGVEADAAAVQIAADGFGDLVGSGAIFQRQVNDLQIPLIELVEEGKVKMPLALGVVGLFQPLGKLAASADAHPEAADGPQQELNIALHVAVVGLGHFRRAMDAGVVDGNAALVPLNGDGDGLLRVLQIGGAPHAEGDKLRVQFGRMLHVVFDA